MNILKTLFRIGMLDPNESVRAKKVARYFDFIMLLVMLWLPLQWYLEAQNELPADFVQLANWVVWGLFLLETVVMTLLVQRKFYYLLSNWLNIIIIIALFPPLWAAGSKYAAALRYIRFIVLVRLILPQFTALQRVLARNHFGATLSVLLVVTLLSGTLVTYIDPEIGSLGQGVWWAVQTVTTVGYGDVVPNTGIGKVFGVVLMILGVGLYSLVSANLAAYFVERGRRQVEKKPQKKVAREFSDIRDKLDKLEESNRQLTALLKEQLDSSSESSDKQNNEEKY